MNQAALRTAGRAGARLSVLVLTMALLACSSGDDGVVADLVGKPIDGKPTQIGGLPAVEYDKVDVPGNSGVESRLLYFFDGNIEYQINCQSTPKKREQITKACDQVLGTLKPI